MKAIKLTAIFFAILGAVIGILYFLGGTSGGDALPPPPNTEYQAYVRQITEDWDNANDWNEEVFLNNCNLIEQVGRDYSVDELRDLNSSRAVEIVTKKMFAEWDKSDCKKSVIDRYAGAINVITGKDGNASSNTELRKAKSVNATYQEAYALAHRPLGLTPTFNGTSWNSYSDYSNSILQKKSSIIGSTNYTTYLKNITDISQGLSAIEGKLSTGRTTFYNALANKICAYYNNIPKAQRNRDNLAQLMAVRNKYESEFPSNRSISTLANSFRNDVFDNED